jgi:hypothetical protein
MIYNSIPDGRLSKSMTCTIWITFEVVTGKYMYFKNSSVAEHSITVHKDNTSAQKSVIAMAAIINTRLLHLISLLPDFIYPKNENGHYW